MFLPLGDDVDKRDFPITGVALIVANVIVFARMFRIVMDHPRDPYALMPFAETWGLVPAKLAEGHVIGVVSYMFLHADIFHLLGNMIVLWAFIHTLEMTLGYVVCPIMYLLWGVAGGLAHAAMNWGSDVPLVGASGAIAGLIGAYAVACGPLTKIRTLVWFFHPIKIDIPASVFVGIWVFFQLLGVLDETDAETGVAWFAHLGGFTAGAVTMLVIGRQTKTQLVQTRHGDLAFVPTEVPDEEDEVEEYEQPPETCPHCGTELTEECRMAENLCRCPNPDCERLIYLELT